MVGSTRSKCYNKRKCDGETSQAPNIDFNATNEEANDQQHRPATVEEGIEVDTLISEDLPKPAAAKKTRGHTKMRDIAMDPGDRVHIDFNDKGQPCGPGSVKLYSYLGPLVREHVPVTLENWHRLSEKIKIVLWKSVKVFNVIFGCRFTSFL